MEQSMCEDSLQPADVPKIILVRFDQDCHEARNIFQQNVAVVRKSIRKMLRKYTLGSGDIVRSLNISNLNGAPRFRIRLTCNSDLMFSSEDLLMKSTWSELPFVTAVFERESTECGKKFVGEALDKNLKPPESLNELATRLEKVEILLSSFGSPKHTANMASVASLSTGKKRPRATSNPALTKSFSEKIDFTPSSVKGKKSKALPSNKSLYVWRTPAEFLLNLDEVIESVASGLFEASEYIDTSPSRDAGLRDDDDQADVDLNETLSPLTEKKKSKKKRNKNQSDSNTGDDSLLNGSLSKPKKKKKIVD
ncbi:unnamed protein product [Mesocestoides corti]|uniref:RMI1_C domain-containing protein n=1 Tax=Mesocestoides corti TaxID=53468 RepID=A0A0R3UJR0_MESCO|nr:unnamed protein product [Mesocestoides corti]